MSDGVGVSLPRHIERECVLVGDLASWIDPRPPAGFAGYESETGRDLIGQGKTREGRTILVYELWMSGYDHLAGWLNLIEGNA